MSIKAHHHITPLKTYLSVGVALMVLTIITVVVSFVHFGAFNLIIAMVIASIKAVLVALFFMHLLYDNKLFMAIFSISLIFVSVFIILTMFDTMQRDSIDEVKAKPIKKNAIIYDK
ncbi:MAG: cytochrome C oxidase subunit IV family protein [Calditrichaceae bacterium]|nr:cytochrome C oxidase subunit IV family protein [Calditrichaceae bacterium]HES59371.1 cytochrome-c oxidase [Caldithrix sp.]